MKIKVIGQNPHVFGKRVGERKPDEAMKMVKPGDVIDLPEDMAIKHVELYPEHFAHYSVAPEPKAKSFDPKQK